MEGEIHYVDPHADAIEEIARIEAMTDDRFRSMEFEALNDVDGKLVKILEDILAYEPLSSDDLERKERAEKLRERIRPLLEEKLTIGSAQA